MANHKQQAIIIGSGLGGIGLAAMLAKAGYGVKVFEKNESLGGRASVFEAEGFKFDMGPSWYLMPDVYERYFALLGENVNDHLELKKLSPSYRVFFKDQNKRVDLYSDLVRDAATFDSLEPGAGQALAKYLVAAKLKYELGVGKFVYKNYDHWWDLLSWDLLKQGSRLSILQSMHGYVAKFFNTPNTQKMLQHTLLFLGNSPHNAPALYSLLSHVDLGQGVFYPMGGIHKLVEAIVNIAKKHGAQFQVQTSVSKIITRQHRAVGVQLDSGEVIPADLVISNADLPYTNMHLLKEQDKDYPDSYWAKRSLAPSAFLLYLGTNKKFSALTHHNLIFSQDWDLNFKQIFKAPELPTDPSFYVCAPSVTDPSVAPDGHENLFVLVPIAAGMNLTSEQLDTYERKILETMETTMGLVGLRESIVFKRRFCVNDFIERYHSYKGSGLGLSHTLLQTAVFRPNTYSRRVKDLYFVGANTNPGIGMPMCLISAELVYKRLIGDKSIGPLKSL